jgi:hypothetical protein
MKTTSNYLGIFFLGLLSVCSMHAESHSDDEFFKVAHEYFQRGAHADALKNFKSINNKDAMTYLCMADVAQKLSEPGKELAYLCKAQKQCSLLQLSLRAQVNARLADLRHKVAEHTSTFDGLTNTVYGFFAAFPLLWLQILFLILWFGLFIYLPRWRGTKNNRLFQYLVLVIFAATLLSVKYIMAQRRHAVVQTAQTTVYSGPGATYHFVQALPAGAEVIVTAVDDGYCKITARGKTLGWVAQKYLKSV